MSSWGSRQQVKYISIISLIIFVLLAIPFYFLFLNKKPNCFDGIQNQNETGTDCGGICQKICPAESLNPLVLYTRIFEIAPGRYSAVANIENPNAKLLAQDVPYSFKIYDSHDVLITEKYGSVFIPPNAIFPIFEGPLNTGNRIPGKVSFQFENYPVWARATTTRPILKISNQTFAATDTLPRLDAEVENPTPYDLKNIEVAALIYDAGGNLIAASKTTLARLPRSSTAPIYFTWNSPFSAPIAKIDIVPNLPLEDFIPQK